MDCFDAKVDKTSVHGRNETRLRKGFFYFLVGGGSRLLTLVFPLFFRATRGTDFLTALTIRIPIEIKFGKATKRSDLNSLAALIEQENCFYGILVNNSEEKRLLTPQIIQIPAGCL